MCPINVRSEHLLFLETIARNARSVCSQAVFTFNCMEVLSSAIKLMAHAKTAAVTQFARSAGEVMEDRCGSVRFDREKIFNNLMAQVEDQND
jgi:hypothetical protein